MQLMAFFPTVTAAAADAAPSPQLLTQLRRREIDGIVVKDVYDRATCDALRLALEAGRNEDPSPSMLACRRHRAWRRPF
jgi:hypothetical protein